MRHPKLLNTLEREQAKEQAQAWFEMRGWEQFDFQQDCLDHYLSGKDGRLHVDTGLGKTFAMTLPFLLENKLKTPQKKGVKVLWITPLRALSVDINAAIQDAADQLEMDWISERRSGDVSHAKRKAQWDSPS